MTEGDSKMVEVCFVSTISGIGGTNKPKLGERNYSQGAIILSSSLSARFDRQPLFPFWQETEKPGTIPLLLPCSSYFLLGKWSSWKSNPLRQD